MAEFTGLHADLTRKIIAAARRVHRTLGTGFLEKVYENSLAPELTDAGLTVVQSAPIEVGLLINFGITLDIRRRILTNDRKGFFDPPPVSLP